MRRCPRKAYCSDRTVNIGASPSPVWNGWGPDLVEHALHHLQRHHAQSSGQAQAEVGLRVRRRCQRVRRAHGAGGHTVRRQRRRRGAGPEHGFRLRSLGLSGQRAGAIRHRRGPQRQDACSGVHRSHRMGLRRGGRDRTPALEEEARAARIHAADRFRRRSRRSGLHSGRVLGRNPIEQSGLSVLHLPRQRDGVARQGWRPRCGRPTRFARSPGKSRKARAPWEPGDLPARACGDRRRWMRNAACCTSRPATISQRPPPT